MHRYSLRNDSNGGQLTDALQYVFMEVGRFNKPLDECNSFEDKFLYFFKNLPNFAVKPDTRNDSYFEQLLEAAEYSNMTKAEREAYNRRLKIQRDNYAADEFAREKAEKEFAERLEKGLAEGKKTIATKLLSKGFPDKEVAEITGLSLKEVLALKERGA